MTNHRPATARANRTIAVAVFGVAATMLGMAYAAVPLYRLFCQVTGFAGTPIVAEQAPQLRGERKLSVRFDANVSPELNWSFAPEQSSIMLQTGATATVFYKVRNNANRPVTAQALYNVSPDQAGGFFNKISCFCFTEQTLGPGESLDMPVVFFLDPALEKDATMKKVDEITLSYTFVPVRPAKTSPVASRESGGPKL